MDNPGTSHDFPLPPWTQHGQRNEVIGDGDYQEMTPEGEAFIIWKLWNEPSETAHINEEQAQCRKPFIVLFL